MMPNSPSNTLSVTPTGLTCLPNTFTQKYQSSLNYVPDKLSVNTKPTRATKKSPPKVTRISSN